MKRIHFQRLPSVVRNGTANRQWVNAPALLNSHVDLSWQIADQSYTYVVRVFSRDLHTRHRPSAKGSLMLWGMIHQYVEDSCLKGIAHAKVRSIKGMTNFKVMLRAQIRRVFLISKDASLIFTVSAVLGDGMYTAPMSIKS
jgi:hypothetical protein